MNINLVEYEGQTYNLLEKFGAADVPDAMQAELTALGDLGEREAWGIAKRVQKVVDMLHAENVHAPMMKVYAAIGDHARKSSETVRMYYGVWKEIPADVLNLYSTDKGHEISFHQFKALVPKLRGKPSQEWVSEIGAWLTHAADTLRSPASVDGIRAWLAGKHGAATPAIGRHRRTIAAAKKLAQDDSVPDRLRSEYQRHVQTVGQIIDTWGYTDWVTEP